MKEIKLKKDKYLASRGGKSKLLDICCDHCRKHLFYYQKDGPGVLKRMYIDRIIDPKTIKLNKDLVCPYCNRILAKLIIWEKEERAALRLFVGAVVKRTVKKIEKNSI